MNLKRICSFITALSLIFTIFSATYPEKAEAAVWFQDNFETDEKLGMWQSIGGGSVEISDEKNGIRGEEVKISTENSRVSVYVIPANEELAIARDTKAIVTAQ